MSLSVMRISTVLSIFVIIQITCSRQTREGRAQLRNNTYRSINIENISHNDCVSDKICVHGICSRRTQRCVCYKEWKGEVCDKLIEQPKIYSNEIRPDSARKSDMSNDIQTQRLSGIDRYVAELMATFFPRLRDYFRKILGVNQPRKHSSTVSYQTSAQPDADIPDMPKNEPARRSNRKIKTFNALNGNNLDKYSSVRPVVKGNRISRSDSNRYVNSATRNNMNQVTKTNIVNDIPSDASALSTNSKTAKRVSRNVNNHHGNGSLGLDALDNKLALGRIPDRNNVPIVTVNVQPLQIADSIVTTDDVIDDVDASDDACKDNYKERSETERMCYPGLVCKYGKCSRDNKGSYIAFECACDPGAVGLMCENKCCLNCGTNGRCDIYYDGSEYCKCRRDYYGSRCEHSGRKIIYSNPRISPLITVRRALSNALK